MKGKKFFIAAIMALTSVVSVTAFAGEMTSTEIDSGGGSDTD